MTLSMLRREALGALAALTAAPWSAADTSKEVPITCPICDRQYNARVTTSEFRSGQRLDLRPLGELVSPPRVPVCPKCGFVDYRHGKDYPEGELKDLRAFVLSDEYKKLAGAEVPYFRLAKLFERLKKPPSTVAYQYLQASWEAEDTKKGERQRAYLAAALDAYDKAIADDGTQAGGRQIARVVKGELLRRLGRFDEAAKHFDAVGKLEESKAEPYPRVIAAELEFIGKKDDQPHELPPSKGKD
jgi:uncharacterized protein (DUF2225 family)